jgi:MYXO-CTERM domain-containing protein
MKKIAALLVLAAGSAANADILLTIDLSVVNQVTITSTAGLSSATATGGTGTGILLQNYWIGAATPGATGTFAAGVGPFRSVNGSVGDNSPSLYRDTAAELGLNIWSFASTATFTTGQQAFSGSFTATLSAAEYADMLASNAGGNIYFQADDTSDIPNAVVIGQWAVVPTPGAAAVLGLGGLALGRRRRA